MDERKQSHPGRQDPSHTLHHSSPRIQKLDLYINGNRLDTKKHPTILGLTFDPKLTFNEHINQTEIKASKALKLVKAISGTNWGQQKETILHTYKAYTRPILEYACPVWAPIDSQLLQHIKTTVNTKLSTQMCNRSHKRQQQLPHRNKSLTNQKTYTHDHVNVQRGSARLGTSST